MRQRGILVTACASTLGDSYCALAWGKKLAGEASAELAGGVLRGDDEALDPQERALATWARAVTRDPNGTTTSDVEALRSAGFDDGQIFAITLFVALRLAFSTVNDALGAHPDAAVGSSAPDPVRAAVTFGRPVASRSSPPINALFLSCRGGQDRRMDRPPEDIELTEVGAVLRRSRVVDLDALQEAIEESRDHLRPFMFWADQSRDETAGFLERSEAGWDGGQEFGYLIRDAGTAACSAAVDSIGGAGRRRSRSATGAAPTPAGAGW